MIRAHTCDLPGRRLEWKQELVSSALGWQMLDLQGVRSSSEEMHLSSPCSLKGLSVMVTSCLGVSLAALRKKAPI